MSWCAVTRVGKSHNPDYWGTYEIVTDAQVTKDTVPGAYQVVLFTRRDLAVLAKTVSASADGSYRFTYLSTTQNYVLVAFDAGASPVTPAISDTPNVTLMTFDF